MDEKENKHITVLIGGRPYPLKIKEGDEPIIRKIVKEINDKLNRFQLTYTNKDKQDCLSMAVLTYAVDLYKAEQSVTEISNPTISSQLTELDEMLDQLLAG
jgi:cell division protein ZapA